MMSASFGVQYLLADMTFFNDYHYLNLVNYFKLYGLNFFARYSVVRFGDACIASVAAAAVTLLLMAVLCTVTVLLLSAHRRYTHRSPGGGARCTACGRWRPTCGYGRLRAGPDINSKYVFTAYKGATFEYLGRVDSWYKVLYNGEEAYVSITVSTLK